MQSAHPKCTTILKSGTPWTGGIADISQVLGCGWLPEGCPLWEPAADAPPKVVGPDAPGPKRPTHLRLPHCRLTEAQRQGHSRKRILTSSRIACVSDILESADHLNVGEHMTVRHVVMAIPQVVSSARLDHEGARLPLNLNRGTPSGRRLNAGGASVGARLPDHQHVRRRTSAREGLYLPHGHNVAALRPSSGAEVNVLKQTPPAAVTVACQGRDPVEEGGRVQGVTATPEI